MSTAISEYQPQGVSIEYFHVYTDSVLDELETGSIATAAKLKRIHVNASTIILIDDYNPKLHAISEVDVFSYLSKFEFIPDYWAYESELVSPALTLLDCLPNAKFKRRYQAYIDSHNKIPCSLLTASWYLARAGYLDYSFIQSNSSNSYRPCLNIINVLPDIYSEVEVKAHKIISKSSYADFGQKIETIFLKSQQVAPYVLA